MGKIGYNSTLTKRTIIEINVKTFVSVYQPDVVLRCASPVGVPQYLQVNQLKAKLITVTEKMMVTIQYGSSQ